MTDNNLKMITINGKKYNKNITKLYILINFFLYYKSIFLIIKIEKII